MTKTLTLECRDCGTQVTLPVVGGGPSALVSIEPLDGWTTSPSVRCPTCSAPPSPDLRAVAWYIDVAGVLGPRVRQDPLKADILSFTYTLSTIDINRLHAGATISVIGEVI